MGYLKRLKMASAKCMSLLTLCALEDKRIPYSSTFYSPQVNKYIQINMLSCAHHTALCQQLGCFFFLCSCHLLVLYHMLNIKTVLIFFTSPASKRDYKVQGKMCSWIRYCFFFTWIPWFHAMELEINVYYYLILDILWYYRK